MADVTITQLSKDVKTPVEKLLKQIEEAGLKSRTENDSVTQDEKTRLLAYLQKNHGAEFQEPRRITLKRKTTTRLKTSGQRTVQVEVRKKRTYVKRVEPAGPAADQAEGVELSTAMPQEMVPEAAMHDTASQPVPVDTPSLDTTVDGEAAHPGTVTPEATSAASVPAAEEPVAEPVVDVEAPVLSPEQAREEAKKNRHKKTREDERDEVERRKKAEKPKVAPKPVKRIADVVAIVEESESDSPLPNRSYRKPRKKRGQVQRTPAQPVSREVVIPASITVNELAQRMAVKSSEVIKRLMGMGVMATLNHAIDQETAQLVAEEMGHRVKLHQEDAVETRAMELVSYSAAEQVTRAPVVSVMGHVDHGKTSLLDYIRRTKVAAGESGGITQHIGAYHVETGKGMITFLDTPGHAAFTAMRARGAHSTDIVILVVAADDGVMPQTREAVQHAKSAGVPIVVAVNKVDKEDADPDRVKNELTAIEVIPEDWGGDTQFVNVSAHTGEGIEELLESVSIQAELLELQAAPSAPAKGVVVEARLDKGRGSVATLLVQNGTLNLGDIVLAGEFFGRVRAMVDHTGKKMKTAGPSIPVEVLGLNGSPAAGDDFQVLPDEKTARDVSRFRQDKERATRLGRQQVHNLENLFENMGKGAVKELNIVLKTDVKGSLEALATSLTELGNQEVQVRIIASGVGGITETDANLAVSTNAILIGFNVRAEGAARKIVEREGVELRYYSIIYNILDDVKQALTGMLAPEYREDILGIAQVRQTFKSPKFGQVAGCMVTEGTIYRNKPIRVLRDNVVIFEGELESLRRFKDDVQEVRSGTECGIGVRNYEVKVGDQIEVFDRVRVERTL